MADQPAEAYSCTNKPHTTKEPEMPRYQMDPAAKAELDRLAQLVVDSLESDAR